MRTIYCINGLGADRRVFSRLSIPDFRIQPIDWPMPLPGEPVHDYACRMIDDIQIEADPILLGHSFGGVLALEMSVSLRPSLTILISSVKNRREIPWYYRAAGRIGLHSLLSYKPSDFARKIGYLSNGVREPEDIELFDAMFNQVDSTKKGWAVDQLLGWQGCETSGQIIHIHGSADRLLPIRYVDPDITVQNGSHFMIVSDAGRISDFIRHSLSDYQ